MNFMHVRKLNNSKESRLNRTLFGLYYVKYFDVKMCAIIFSLYYKFVTIVICLLLAEPLKRAFLTLTIIYRNNNMNAERGQRVTHVNT